MITPVYKSNHRSKTIHNWRIYLAIAACLLFICGIGIIVSRTESPLDNNIGPVSGAPAHFYYDGKPYLYSGEVHYSLPADYLFAGVVNNVGDIFTGNDLDGNVDGYVFMSKLDKSGAFFRWKDWNPAVDGDEPYLYLSVSQE